MCLIVICTVNRLFYHIVRLEFKKSHTLRNSIAVLIEKHNISVTVIDLRCLVPLDLQSIKREVKKSGIIFTVEENPRLCGWGAEISSIIVEQCFDQLKTPIIRITTPHIPIPSADILENNTIPSTELIIETLANKLKKI